jgi:hypothetical protein
VEEVAANQVEACWIAAAVAVAVNLVVELEQRWAVERQIVVAVWGNAVAGS